MRSDAKRVLVLGATGFLGGHVVPSLLLRGHSVTALVRGKPAECEFVRTRLYEKVRVVGGLAEDAVRLRQLLALHDIDAVIQCAAGPTAAATHELTRAVLTAVAHTAAKPMTIVPLRAADPASQPRFQTPPHSKLSVAFVRLPELFGPGELRPDRWCTRLFHAAASGQMLPWPETVHPWLDAGTAADHLADALTTGRADSLGQWIDAAPSHTTAELMAAVRTNAGGVADTLDWYKANLDRIPARMPAMTVQRAAA